MRRILLAVTAVLLVLPPSVQAAKVKVWHHHSPADYEKAKLKQTVISNEGAIRLSRQLKPLASLEARHVWDVVEDAAGNLLVATGDEGKIYQVAPDGRLQACAPQSCSVSTTSSRRSSGEEAIRRSAERFASCSTGAVAADGIDASSATA